MKRTIGLAACLLTFCLCAPRGIPADKEGGHGEGHVTLTPDKLQWVPNPETMGGVTDRSYRRQDGYVGVGAKLKRVTEEMKKLGKSITRE